MNSRKLYFILIFTFLTSIHFLFAQVKQTKKKFNVRERFISSVGLSYMVKDENISNEKLYGVNFSPTINLLNRYSDVSVSLATTIGAAYHSKSLHDTSNYFLFSIPAFIDLNIGHLASQDFYSKFGFFIGAGYGFVSDQKKNSYGLAFTGGVRTWFLKNSFTLRYTQLRLDANEKIIHELSLQINVGAYLNTVKSNNKISNFMKPYGK